MEDSATPLRRIRFKDPQTANLHITASLYELLQMLSLTMFEKIPLDQLLAQKVADQIRLDSGNQLFLFE